MTDDDDVLLEMGAAVRDFRTSGPNCHWCYRRPTAYVWCPYSTHVCEICHDLIEQGREWEVAESLVAATVVRGRTQLVPDLDAWRGREHENIRRWLEVRTHAHRVDGEPYRDERHVETI